MPNGRSKFREILLLLVPCLLLLGAGAWLTSRQRQHPSTSEDNGPIRTIVTKIEKVPVTPLEKWQGYDWKVVLHTKVVGDKDLLSQLRLYGNQWYKGEPELVWKKGKKEKVFRNTRFLIADPTGFRKARASVSEVPKQLSETKPWMETTTLLCSAQELPQGGEVYLRGTTWITSHVQIQPPLTFPVQGVKKSAPKKYDLAPVPAKYSLPLRTYGADNAEQEIDRTTPRLQKVNIYEARSPIKSSGGMSQPDTAVEFELIPAASSASNDTHIRAQALQLVDHQGKVIPGAESLEKLNIEIVPKPTRDGNLQHTLQFRCEDIKLPPLAANLQVFISCGDSWPAQLNIPLPGPDHWYRKRCDKELQLLEAKQYGNQVWVRLRYRGKQKLVVKGENGWFDERYQNALPPPEVYWRDHLISNWSQHVDWDEDIMDELPATVDRVDTSGEFVTVVYGWSWPVDTIKPKVVPFKARIGIRNKGFIPISLPVKITPRPADANTIPVPPPTPTPDYFP